MGPGEIAYFLAWPPTHLPFSSCYIRALTSLIHPVRSHRPRASLLGASPAAVRVRTSVHALCRRHWHGAHFLKPHVNLAIASPGGPSAKSALHRGRQTCRQQLGVCVSPVKWLDLLRLGFCTGEVSLMAPASQRTSGSQMGQFPQFLAHGRCSVNLSVRFSPSLLFRGPPSALLCLTLGGAAGDGLASHGRSGSSTFRSSAVHSVRTPEFNLECVFSRGGGGRRVWQRMEGHLTPYLGSRGPLWTSAASVNLLVFHRPLLPCERVSSPSRLVFK